ncbi:hypothetical protein MMC30_007019 [Trapelia coarctata]|nr:hypothetical protein [Trapelia coarctata]
MVRIRHRYLLVNILYPDPPPQASAQPHQTAKDGAQLPVIVQFHQPTPSDLTPQILLQTIREQVALLYGDYGVGITSSGLQVKYFSPATSTFILRCPRSNYQLIWSTITYITHLPKTSRGSQPRPCVMKVIRVSGTIRKAEEEAIRRARADILKARREVGDGAAGDLEGFLGEPVDGGRDGEEGIVDLDDVDNDSEEVDDWPC